LSKELVTIRADLPVSLDLESMKVKEPDYPRLRDIFIDLEFHALARDMAVQAPVEEKPKKEFSYTTVDTLDGLAQLVKRAREAGLISLDTEAFVDADSPQTADPLRSSLISIAIGVGGGEAYYFPLRHRSPQGGQ